MRTVYLDHASTTKIAPEVRRVMNDFLSENYGNPLSVQHLIGQRAHNELEGLRAQAALELGVTEDRIILTSGATEANNSIVLGFAAKYQGRAHHIIIAALEHRSIFEAAEQAVRWFGSKLSVIPVDRAGTLDLDFVRRHVVKVNGPALVCVMHTNNEIPVANPVEEIGKLCQSKEVFFHCDAVQAIPRGAFSPGLASVSSSVISPHKFYGPKGCGILVAGKEDWATPWEPLIVGGGQEQGKRSGTVNTASGAGGLAAIVTLRDHLVEDVRHLNQCGSFFSQEMQTKIPGMELVVPVNERAPGIISFWIKNVDANTLLESIPHICISRGATCSSGGDKVSHVPNALGIPIEIGANILRASFGRDSSLDDVAYAVDEIARYVDYAGGKVRKSK